MQDQDQVFDPLTQQMIKGDALIAALAQVRDDLRSQADRVDAVIKVATQMDAVTGASSAYKGGEEAAKGRLTDLLRKMHPELAGLSDAELVRRVGGIK